MKLVFFGTPDFAKPFLEALINDQDIQVVAVVCQPDKPQGRKGEIVPPAIKRFAQTNAIPVLQPVSLKQDEVYQALQNYQADIFVVVAYGKLIPQAILDIPKLGTLNVHPSLLPKYRGPSPIQWAIANGDQETGVTIMLLDAGMDTGPVLSQEVIPLDSDETYQTLISKIHQTGPALLIQALKKYCDGFIQAHDQDDGQASVTHLLTRMDGEISWDDDCETIERKVRAYQPWPGTWTMWNRDAETPMRLKILKSKIAQPMPGDPGTVHIIDHKLYVNCKKGALEILEIQPEGKASMKSGAFIQGYADIHEATLSSSH